MPENEVQQINSHQIIDFSTPFNGIIEDYSLNDNPNLITRNNFTDFLIKSFTRSRGDGASQILIFDWVAAKTGQNVRASLNNFVESRAWNTLSTDEKEMLEKSFNNVKVPGHQKVINFEEGLYKQIKNRLKPVSTDTAQISIVLGRKKDELRDMSWEELKMYIDKLVKIHYP